ncbi:MAG: mechanosensitive ion channel [Alphaproteobacteria bacterium]|nr:mechanosensitive ion channel [Alphaproteobacteria bacterium]
MLLATPSRLDQTPAPQTQPPSQPAFDTPTFDDLWAEAARFAGEIGSLDPQQAFIRAGMSILLVGAALLALTMLRLVFKAVRERSAKADADAGTVAEADQSEKKRLGGRTMLLARVAVWSCAAFVILGVWGLDLRILMAGPLGDALRVIARIAIIGVLSIAVMEAVEFAITQLFARMARRARDARRAGQLRTLAPVVSAVARNIVLVVAAMMALAEFGVEVGPLIAGAGIIGLAVGFGAQTLVKDFLTGMFLIIEDVVSVGDIARIADFGGVVEEMTLRTIKLRDFDGTLHVFPYSEAQVIHNLTKDFSRYVFDLSIAYSSDINKALGVMAEIGEDLRRDPELGRFIREPLEIVGVDQLADSGVTLKARITTDPGKQWSVGREYLKRIKLAFDAAGVEIPFPHLKLVAPDADIPVRNDPTQGSSAA